MPLNHISKRTEKLLLAKQESSGLPKSKIIELAVMRFSYIPVRKVKNGCEKNSR